MRIAILMPTYGRPDQLRQRANEMLCQDYPAGVELVLVLAIISTDGATWEVAHDLVSMWYDSDRLIVLVKRPPGSTAVDGWNRAYKAVRSVADWFVLGADDQVYQSGWAQAALSLIHDTGALVVGLNDGHTDIDQYGPHYMIHRSFIDDELGGYMVPPVYQSWWFDREVCERAQRRGVYAAGWGVHVDHTHPDWHTAPMDETYKAAWHLHDIDKATYVRRRSAGYPPDPAPLEI